jgi:hypothetical protein
LARLIDAGLPDHKMKRLGTAAEQVGEALGWNRDRGRYLTRAQAEQLHEADMDSLRTLNSRLACMLPPPKSLDERGFVERGFLPDAAHIPPEALVNFYQTLADIVVGQSDAVTVEEKVARKARTQAEKRVARVARKAADKRTSRQAAI